MKAKGSGSMEEAYLLIVVFGIFGFFMGLSYGGAKVAVAISIAFILIGAWYYYTNQTKTPRHEKHWHYEKKPPTN